MADFGISVMGWSGMISLLCTLASILSRASRRHGYWDWEVEFLLGLRLDFICDIFTLF